MQMHEVGKLMEVDSVAKANNALDEGWTLVAVVPSADGSTYVLGRKKEPAKGFFDVNINFDSQPTKG